MAATTSESEAEIFVPSHRNDMGTEYDKDAPELAPTISKGETEVGTTGANESSKMVLQPSDVSIPEVVRSRYAASYGPRATASRGVLTDADSVSKSANVQADVIKATREAPPGFATTLEDVATSLEIPQAIPLRIGLEGDPGIGKTLFCQRIALRWALGLLDNYALVLLVDVPSVRSSLRDYLYGEHFGLDSSITPDVFWDYVANHQESVLLLVDGLETLTQKQLHNLGFYDIFVGGALERSHVIITARSGLRTTTLMKVCDFVYILQGPTTVAKLDYVRSYFVEKNASLAERLVAEIETNPQLLELASNPSCLALLCHLQVGQDAQPFRLPTTVTELYTEVFRRLLMSPYSVKPYILDGDRSWKDIHLRLMALGQIAWEELKCNRTTFSVQDLRDTYKVLDRLLPMGVLRIEKQYERGLQNELVLSQKCSFINRTWQEYFAAFYVGEKAKSQPNSRQTAQYLQACLERDNSLVCLFTAGHLKSKASPLIRTIEREIKFYRKEVERVPKSREAELRLTDLLRTGLECLQECRSQTSFVHVLAQFFTEKLHITEKCTAACLYSIADVLKFQGREQTGRRDQVFVNTLQISVSGRLPARLPMFFSALQDADLRVHSLVFEDNLNLSSARSCGGSISLDCRSLRRLLQRHKAIDEVSCHIDNITISRPAFGAIIDAMTASRSLCRANFRILYDYDSRFAEEFCSLPFEALAVSSLQEFTLELEESCFSQLETETSAENRLSLLSPVVRMLQTSPQMRKMCIAIQDTEVHSEKPATRAYTLQVIPLLQAVTGERTLQEFSLQVPRADILILTGTRDLVSRNVVLKKLQLTAAETSTPRETTAVSEILRALTTNRSLQCFSLTLEDVPPSCNPNELLRDVTEVLRTNPILRTFSFVIQQRPLALFCSGLTLKNLVEAVETNSTLTRVDIVGFYAQDPKSAKLVADSNCATTGRKVERNLDIPYIWDACSLD